MKTGYVLFCTVCDTGHSSHHLWNQHLLTKLHQGKARVKINQWDESVRKCAVVLYSRQSLTVDTCVEIFNYFTSGKWPTIIVTDLVLSEKRPHIAVLQFESKKKVNELFIETGGPIITIGNQMMQIRRLGKMLTLEWEELVVSFQEECTSFNESPQQKEADPKSHSKIVPISIKDETEWSIYKEFQTVLHEMEIPDEEINQVENIMSEIKQVLSATWPDIKIGLYRHNFLKIRNNHKSNVYLLYMYIHNSGAKEGFTAINRDHTRPLHDAITTGQENLPSNSILRTIKYLEGRDKQTTDIFKAYARGPRLIDKQSGIIFILNNCPSSLPELQLSELVKYYCEFDNRVKPLLSLLYYWAKVNNITIARNHIAIERINGCSPEPTAFEWLLLFFLFHQEKLIPPPSDILERPHQRLSLKNSSIDFGFDFNIKWARNWQRSAGLAEVPKEDTDLFVLSVFQILHKFFVFYGEVLPTPCILNTPDGKLITLENCVKWNSRRFKDILHANQRHVHVMHPLGPTSWRLSFWSSKWTRTVQPAMLRTAKELGDFVSSLEQWLSSKPSRETFSYSLKTVLHLNG